MANYAEDIQLPDTSVMYAPIQGIDSVKVPVERYVKTVDGTPVDSTAVYHTPDGWLVTDNHGKESGLYWQDHPEGKAQKVKALSEEERKQTFDKAFGKSKILDNGGILSQAPKELVELVQAAMSDEGAAKKLSQLMSQRPDLTDMVEQIAAELQGAQAMKCGGRVKKKALGSKLIKAKKASCGCQLKKVGGRLIEVDGCTGLPVHKTGDKIQYAKFGDGIKRFFTNFANAAGQYGANFTPGAGSIAGSIVDGTPSGIVGSPAQESTGHNGVENQNNRMTYQTFDNWLQENAPEYRDPSKRAELFHKYGLGSVSMYNRGKEQNMALWNKMKADKAAGVEFGGPQIDTNYSPTLTVNEMTPPVIQYPQSGSRQDESLRNAAIAQMSGKRISNRERRKWGEAYDALQSGANPNDLTNIQKLRIQRMGKALRTPTAKNGGQLNYANYLN